MTLMVVKPGLQTTLQGLPFSGYRHLGMPAAGAADCLSLALANRLVSNIPTAIALEITLDDAKFKVEHACTIALTGAASFIHLNGEEKSLHSSIPTKAGDEIHVGAAHRGCRSYLALAGDIDAQSILDGQSTYLGAALGGFRGRALAPGDIVKLTPTASKRETYLQTPDNLRPVIADRYLIRVTAGPEFSALSADQRQLFFEGKHEVGQRSNRMGLSLSGIKLAPQNSTQMQSAPVFPGTIQCPPDGESFLLGPDGQTTGGYPRIAQVIRADRHLIGQLRPHAKIQFAKVTNQKATEIYRQKLSLLTPWLGTVSLW